MRHNSQFLLNIVDKLQSMNYHFALDILNSADYGVPQDRERLFIIGSKTKNNIIFPRRLNSKNKRFFGYFDLEPPKYNKFPSLKKRISSNEALDDIAYEIVRENPTDYKYDSTTKYQELISRNSKKVYNHKTTRHGELSILRFSKLKPGQGMIDLPAKYRTNRRSLMRMIPSKPTRTITSCPEDFIHYSLDRIITIREMARLQSYPDTYIFYGPSTTGGRTRQYACCQVQQVANSVPPLLGLAVAEAVLDTFRIKHYNYSKMNIEFLNNQNKKNRRIKKSNQNS